MSHASTCVRKGQREEGSRRLWWLVIELLPLALASAHCGLLDQTVNMEGEAFPPINVPSHHYLPLFLSLSPFSGCVVLGIRPIIDTCSQTHPQ